MINHGRTLLLNRSGASRPAPSFFLEEFVDPTFVPVTVPPALQSISNILVGNGDDAFANYRVKQLLTCIHSTEFVQYLTVLDPRITYLNDTNILDTIFGAVVTPLNPQAITHPVYVTGQLNISPSRLLYRWLIEMTAPGGVTVTDPVTGKSEFHVVSFTNDLSSLVPFVGQKNLSFRVPDNTFQALWQVDYLTLPDGDLSDLLAPLVSARGGIDALFTKNGLPAGEPYTTFQQLWEKHCFIQYKLAGVVLAFIYKLEAARLNG